MIKKTIALLILLSTTLVYSQEMSNRRPVATYSIVALDSVTGELGVAVQSHWFSVGTIVPWAESGVGAVATQSFVDPRYGTLGLELMKTGRTAEEALNALISTDSGKSVRQVAMIDINGNVAAHTGSEAIYAAGHHIGQGYSVQANLMEKSTVWDAMAKAYESAEGDLAERLLQALEAAEREGGDIRGKQSAAILVVNKESTGFPWIDRKFDLHVEDAPDPLSELRRLVTLQRAYLKLNEGDEWVTQKNIPKAMEAYLEATNLVSDKAVNGEAAFWVGVTLANENQLNDAIPYLQRAYAQDKNWAELIKRLPDSKLLPDDKKLIKKLIKGMKK